MTTSRPGLLLLLPLLLTACPSLPGPVAQLQRFKDAEAAKNYTAIAHEPVNSDCTSGGADDVCSQLYEISGRACMQLVASAAGPNATCPPASEQASKQLQCAASGFAAARQRGKFSASQVEDMTQMDARALYCSATLSDTATGVPLDQQAGSELATLPPDPERDRLAASASLNIANREDLPPAQRCTAAQQSVQVTQRGLQGDSAEGAVADGLRGTRGAAQATLRRLKCGA